ncbi:GNAT family N-acetyltransferase [Sinisalibacter aestuarii]|uniref:N-acetyltransferase domain-containing protein n=1 Tax=Sinisalibacter aestuarii TaxID=2949426 RepID=A0ABQ5LWD0_9RHOB|nr:GNAT family N-acetyltransferase [Sinisalibacter aestuarii]GKY88690.1 hypothetical protein STA1M1_25590 [Sinisalibacter aestuarii]
MTEGAAGPQAKVRPFASGDIDWIVQRHGALYAEDQGFDASFEALVAEILADFMARDRRPVENGWIMEADGARLGCVFVVAEDDETARLRLMLVEPGARGQGVGQSLLETAIDHARSQGFTHMVLWTQEALHAAVRLYARNGFRLVESATGVHFGREIVNQTWQRAL